MERAVLIVNKEKSDQSKNTKCCIFNKVAKYFHILRNDNIYIILIISSYHSCCPEPLVYNIVLFLSDLNIIVYHVVLINFCIQENVKLEFFFK